MIRTAIAISCLVVFIAGQVLLPRMVSLGESTAGDSTLSGLRSNVIIEIRAQQSDTSAVWLGTGRGLSVIRDSTTLRTFISSSTLVPYQSSLFLPEGGVSAIGVKRDTILVAMAADTIASGESFPKGNGLVLTYNPGDTVGVNWLYIPQPKDADTDTSIAWGGRSLNALAITTAVQNVSYDIAVGPHYFWMVSWAGGLRRLPRDSTSADWQRVPLPLDSDSQFPCDDPDYDYDSYKLNPQDPEFGGNHNHKGFSVLAYHDTVWVGTANGINRGIMDASGCIDWEHYSFPLSGITGNWVVGMAKQVWNGQRRIWAVTLRAEEAGEENGVSYTPDDGQTWYAVSALRGERGYNIFVANNLVYVATENGLWKSEDGVNFALFQPAIDAENNDQILGNDVYSVVHDNRSYWGEALWIGTGDGLARTPDPSSNESIWQIYRTNFNPGKVYAYPNPFSPYVDNVIDGDGYVRFHLKVRRSRLVQVNIYNFAMEKVNRIEHWLDQGRGAVKWDGRDNNGNLVANGVYFCNLVFDNQDHWIKLIVLK